MPLTIDQLHLTLPGHFAARAETVARRVGDALARRPVTRSLALSQLTMTLPPAAPGETDDQLAGRIADAIHDAIVRGGG